MNRRIFFAALPLLAACGSSKSEGEVKFYPIHGEIRAVNPGDRTAVIKHEDIPNFMEAMTMEFPIKRPEELARLRVGQIIRGTLCQRPSSLEYWVEGIQVEKEPALEK